MATVEERRYKESEEYEEYEDYEKLDMFNTDRDIAKGHFTLKYMEYEDEDYEDFDMYNTDRDIVKGHTTFENEEDKEFDEEFNTDRDIAKGHITFNFEENEEDQEEYKSFTKQWRLYEGCHGGMDVWELRRQLMNYKDGPLEAAMYDALGSKIDTLSETEMMEELENLAVEEIVAMISEEKPVKQPTAHSSPAHSSPDHRNPAHSSPAHSSPAKQPPAKFKPPAHAQALVTLGLQREDTHGHAAGRGAEKVRLYTLPRQKDQHKTWHQKTSTRPGAIRPTQDLAQEDQHQDLAPEDQHKTWYKKTSTDLAQETHQTEKKPPDNTKVGLIGGLEPGLQMGGQDPGQQVGGRDHGLQDGGTRSAAEDNASEDTATLDNAAEDFAMAEDQNEAPAEDTEHDDPAMMGGYNVHATGEGKLQSSTMGGVPSKSPDERASKTPPEEDGASEAPDEFDTFTPDDAKEPHKYSQTEIPAERTKNQCGTVDNKPLIVVAKTGKGSKIPVEPPPPAKTDKSTVEKVKQPQETSNKITKPPLNKKAAKTQEVSKPLKNMSKKMSKKIVLTFNNTTAF